MVKLSSGRKEEWEKKSTLRHIILRVIRKTITLNQITSQKLRKINWIQFCLSHQGRGIIKSTLRLQMPTKTHNVESFWFLALVCVCMCTESCTFNYSSCTIHALVWLDTVFFVFTMSWIAAKQSFRTVCILHYHIECKARRIDWFFGHFRFAFHALFDTQPHKCLYSLNWLLQ